MCPEVYGDFSFKSITFLLQSRYRIFATLAMPLISKVLIWELGFLTFWNYFIYRQIFKVKESEITFLGVGGRYDYGSWQIFGKSSVILKGMVKTLGLSTRRLPVQDPPANIAV